MLLHIGLLLIQFDTSIQLDFVAVGSIIDVLGVVFGAALFCFYLDLSIRRLHDIDASGWWALILFIPLINTVFFFILLLQRGSPGNNLFGEQAPPVLALKGILLHRWNGAIQKLQLSQANENSTATPTNRTLRNRVRTHRPAILIAVVISAIILSAAYYAPHYESKNECVQRRLTAEWAQHNQATLRKFPLYNLTTQSNDPAKTVSYLTTWVDTVADDDSWTEIDFYLIANEILDSCNIR
jgi:hypothetical protein